MRLRDGFQARFALLASAALLSAGAAWAAGTVEVSYVTPEKFSDAGMSSIERDRSLSGLSEIYRGLARWLPDGQTLRIDVLDVDLAGELRPLATREVRVVRGGIDFPKISMRYTLVAGGKTLKSGQQNVSDLNYTYSQNMRKTVGTNLPYEKRMLENWFRAQFVQAQ